MDFVDGFRPSLVFASFMVLLSFTVLALSGCATAQSGQSASLKKDSDSPAFTSPEVRKVWVPDKIDGNKYIKGHYIYVLERGSVWTMQ